jgi:hypothetical protein
MDISETPEMNAKMLEILRKRAEAHAAACADLENDPLIEATFGRRKPLQPIKSTMLYQPGFWQRRQAD